jgi:uncharacterized protein YjbJ (UPF0337 family)
LDEASGKVEALANTKASLAFNWCFSVQNARCCFANDRFLGNFGVSDRWPLFCYIRSEALSRRAKQSINRIERNLMNTLHIKGDWNIAKGKLKQKYSQLTDNDLTYQAGREQELIGRIQKRTGDSKDAVERFIDECYKNDPISRQ